MGGKKKNNVKAKGDSKSGGDGDKDKGDGKLKGGQKIEVRHILCQKHSKKEEALAEIHRLTRGEPKEGNPPSESEPVGKTDPKTKAKAPTHAILSTWLNNFPRTKQVREVRLANKRKAHYIQSSKKLHTLYNQQRMELFTLEKPRQTGAIISSW